MTQQVFDRSVVLDAKHRYVPVRWLEAMIGDAMSPEDAFEFGLDSDLRANGIVQAVRHWRDTGKLELVHANGHGIFRDQDVLPGRIRRDDLARMLAEEWNMGLVEPLVGEVNATPTTEQAAAPSSASAELAQGVVADDAKWKLMREDEWPETAHEMSWRKRANIATAVARGAVPTGAEPVPVTDEAPPVSDALPDNQMQRRRTCLDWFRAEGGKRPSENGKPGKRGALQRVVEKSGIDKDTLGDLLDKAIDEKRNADAFAQLTAKR